MYEIVVIGFGNSLRQDDGFGPVVVERLASRISDPRVELLIRSTLTPELAETLSQTQHAIFVDASANLAPGEVEHRHIECDETADVSLVHFLSPEALLVWTERVYGRAPKAEIWLVGVDQTGLSEDLTPIVASRVDDIVRDLELTIRQKLAAARAQSGSPRN